MAEENNFYCGENLHKAVFETPAERKFNIHSLEPEHTITMWYAADGVGKSTLLLQKALELASGLNVFGGFPTKENANVIYVMTERHRYEAFERIQKMSQLYNFKWENFAITDQLQGFNILIQNDFMRFVEGILKISKVFEDRGGVAEVNIDPIYAIVPRGLTGEEGSGAVTQLCRRLQSELGCSVHFTHHSNRGVKDLDTGKRGKEDMYGSRFLSANCTGVFRIVNTHIGTDIIQEKDSLQCLTKKISLTFNDETYVSLMNLDDSIVTKAEKIKQFIRNCYTLKKDFTSTELDKETGVMPGYRRIQVSIQVDEGVLINLKPKGGEGLYRVLRPPV